ncbi:MAG: mycothiol synthase, partial [Gaiellaceae bacterium]|nr:mycothiol synthase [Gaiellaceae bacterium]
GRTRIAMPDLVQWLTFADLARDTWLYEEDGEVAAFGWAELHDDVGVGIGCVARGFKGRGLGAQLVQRSEAHIREQGAARMHQVKLGPDADAGRLFELQGYRRVRSFFGMAIELDTAPAVPALPDGCALETFDPADARGFHAALDEAFRDHWENHPQSFDAWWQRHQSSPDFDPTLWFLIRDGEEIAAVVRNEPNRNGGGYVGALGVRRPWRGRGFGRALLLRTFAEFHRRGVPRVSLGVDSESPTGATKLYESVGMVTEREDDVYEKALS